MSKRNLSTTRAMVFGDVEPGTECRVCGRAVDDGRSKTCSDYCDNLQTAVMDMLNWSSLRRLILERDDETCQACGYDRSRVHLAADHISDIIGEKLPEKPESPSARRLGAGEADDFDWDAHREALSEWRERRRDLRDRYPAPYEHARDLEVDHITAIADGGHPFDPGNLQTLCSNCHTEKTAAENSDRASTPTRSELDTTLMEYVTDGGESE